MSEKLPQMKAAEAISALDHLCQLDPNAKTAFIRLTGLICTIGMNVLRYFLNIFKSTYILKDRHHEIPKYLKK